MTRAVVPAIDALGLGWVLAALLPGLVDPSATTPPGAVLAVAGGTIGYRLVAHLRPRALVARGSVWTLGAALGLTALATTPATVPPFVVVSLAGCTAAVAGLTLRVRSAVITVVVLQAWYAASLLLTHPDAPDEAARLLAHAAGVAAASCATAALVATSLRRSRQRIDGLVAGLLADRRTLRADEARDRAGQHARAALHDTVLTTLSAVGAGWLRDTPATDLRAEFRASATALADELQTGGDVDLVEAVRSTASAPRFAGLRVDVVASPTAVTAAPAVVEAVRLAVGEALTNVVKHAGVRRAVVEVRAEGADRVRTIVRDTGQGFADGATERDRLGLRHSVHDRLGAVGGTATTRGLPGAGTEVELDAPRHGRASGPVVPSVWSPTGPRTAALWLTGITVATGLGGLVLATPSVLHTAAVLVLLLGTACAGVVVTRTGRFPGWMVAVAAVAGPLVLGIAALSPDGCATLWARPSTGALGVLAVGLLLTMLRPAAESLAVMSLVVAAYVVVVPLLAPGGWSRCASGALSLAAMHAGEVGAAVLVVASMRMAAADARDELLARLAEDDAAQDDAARRSERQRLLPVVRTAVARTLEQLADGELDPHDPDVRRRCSRDARLIRSLLADGDAGDELVTTVVARVVALRDQGIDLAVQGGLPAGALTQGQRDDVVDALDSTVAHLLAWGWRGSGQVTVLVAGTSLVLTVVAEDVPDDLLPPGSYPTEGTSEGLQLDVVDGTLWSTYRVTLPGGHVDEVRGGAA